LVVSEVLAVLDVEVLVVSEDGDVMIDGVDVDFPGG
jgi:hypothetical protein